MYVARRVYDWAFDCGDSFFSKKSSSSAAVSVKQGDIFGGKGGDKGGKGTYTLLKYINRGATCQVWECVEKGSRGTYAMKIIPRKALKLYEHRLIREEIKIMRKLSCSSSASGGMGGGGKTHPNIVNLIEAFETKEYFIIVMDLIEGGELFDLLDEDAGGKGALSEDRARGIVAQLISAIVFVHGQGIIHRDLKPENVVLVTKDSATSPVKIIDFGMAKMFDDGGGGDRENSSSPSSSFYSSRKTKRVSFNTRTVCGTRGYQAPEVLSGSSYSYTCDYWSIGAILFVMLTGEYTPKNAEDGNLSVKEIDALLKSVPKLKSVSENGKRVLKALLNPDPNERVALSRGEDDISAAATRHLRLSVSGGDTTADGTSPLSPFADAVDFGQRLLLHPWFLDEKKEGRLA